MQVSSSTRAERRSGRAYIEKRRAKREIDARPYVVNFRARSSLQLASPAGRAWRAGGHDAAQPYVSTAAARRGVLAWKRHATADGLARKRQQRLAGHRLARAWSEAPAEAAANRRGRRRI
eukprot:scaffold61488_cov50-Phaeocystis_antarctica.AAC.2